MKRLALARRCSRRRPRDARRPRSAPTTVSAIGSPPRRRRRSTRALAARPPKLVPPVPIAVKWRPLKLGSIDLGAPLRRADGGRSRRRRPRRALRGDDARGDRDRHCAARRLDELGARGVRRRAARLPMPRDLGRHRGRRRRRRGRASVVDVRARHCASAGRARRSSPRPASAGFELCPGEHAQLAPGRNLLRRRQTALRRRAAATTRRCAAAQPLHVRGELAATGKLEVAVERCAATAQLRAASTTSTRRRRRRSRSRISIATARPRSSTRAPARPAIPMTSRSSSLGDDDKKRAAALQEAFTAGGVAAIAVGDLDGDGIAEVIAAVRLAVRTRVDLWRLD